MYDLIWQEQVQRNDLQEENAEIARHLSEVKLHANLRKTRFSAFESSNAVVPCPFEAHLGFKSIPIPRGHAGRSFMADVSVVEPKALFQDFFLQFARGDHH